MRVNETETWDEVRGRSIVTRCVKRKLHLFARWPELHDTDELVATVMPGVRAAHRAYTPDRGSYSTFIYRVAFFKLKDLQRKRGRAQDHEDKYREDRAARDALALVDEQLDHGAAEPENLAHWLRGVSIAAQGLVAARAASSNAAGPGRPGYGAARKIAATALMQKTGVSCRGAERLVRNSPELRSAMGLGDVVPDKNWWNRLRPAS